MGDVIQAIHNVQSSALSTDVQMKVVRALEHFVEVSKNDTGSIGQNRLHRKSLNAQTKNIRVRWKNKIVKGYREVTMRFDLNGTTPARRKAFLKEMKCEGYGEPMEGTKDLGESKGKVTFRFEVEPADKHDGMTERIKDAAGIARRHNVKFLGDGRNNIDRKSWGWENKVRSAGNKKRKILNDLLKDRRMRLKNAGKAGGADIESDADHLQKEIAALETELAKG